MKKQIIIIEVSERTMDWHITPKMGWDGRIIVENGRVIMDQKPNYYARIKDTTYWSSGRTFNDAIGDLIRTHPEQFGIEVQDLGRLPR